MKGVHSDDKLYVRDLQHDIQQSIALIQHDFDVELSLDENDDASPLVEKISSSLYIISDEESDGNDSKDEELSHSHVNEVNRADEDETRADEDEDENAGGFGETGASELDGFTEEDREAARQNEIEGDDVKEDAQNLLDDLQRLTEWVRDLLTLPSEHAHLREIPKLDIRNVKAL